MSRRQQEPRWRPHHIEDAERQLLDTSAAFLPAAEMPEQEQMHFPPPGFVQMRHDGVFHFLVAHRGEMERCQVFLKGSVAELQ